GEHRYGTFCKSRSEPPKHSQVCAQNVRCASGNGASVWRLFPTGAAHACAFQPRAGSYRSVPCGEGPIQYRGVGTFRAADRRMWGWFEMENDDENRHIGGYVWDFFKDARGATWDYASGSGKLYRKVFPQVYES